MKGGQPTLDGQKNSCPSAFGSPLHDDSSWLLLRMRNQQERVQLALANMKPEF
jgi:hypothetical protein